MYRDRLHVHFCNSAILTAAVRGIPMVTATEYRELALKFYRWAAESEAEEVRETYLRLAREWTLAALSASDLSTSTFGHSLVVTTRQ